MKKSSEKFIFLGVIVAISLVLYSLFLQVWENKKISVLNKTIETSEEIIKDLQIQLESKKSIKLKEEIDAIIAENKVLHAQVALQAPKNTQNTNKKDFDIALKEISKSFRLKNVRGMIQILSLAYDIKSSQVKFGFQELLKELAISLSKIPNDGWEIQIEGFAGIEFEKADARDPQKNIILAIERAYALGMFLISNGIKPEKIKFKGNSPKNNAPACGKIFLVQR